MRHFGFIIFCEGLRGVPRKYDYHFRTVRLVPLRNTPLESQAASLPLALYASARTIAGDRTLNAACLSLPSPKWRITGFTLLTISGESYKCLPPLPSRERSFCGTNAPCAAQGTQRLLKPPGERYDRLTSEFWSPISWTPSAAEPERPAFEAHRRDDDIVWNRPYVSCLVISVEQRSVLVVLCDESRPVTSRQ